MEPKYVDAAAVFDRTHEVLTHARKEWAYFDRFGNRVELFVRTPKAILAARGMFAGAQDRTTDGDPIERFKTSIKARDEVQLRWVNEVSALAKQGESFIAVAHTGFGKTYAGTKAIARLQRKTLIVVPKTDIMDQWLKVLRTCTSLTPEQIGVAQADRCEYQGRSVVVGMLQSLAMHEYEEDFYNAFGVVVFDESHRIAADIMQQVCWRFPARVRIGLSATPERKDGRFATVRAHVGPIRVRAQKDVQPFRVLVYQTSWVCPRRTVFDHETGEHRIEAIPHSPGRTAHITKLFKNDAERVDLVARCIARSFHQGRKVVAFFLTLAHLEVVSLHLTTHYGIPAAEQGRYIGGSDSGKKREARLRTQAKKRILLATYKMIAEGTDIPDLDTAVLADPMADVRQSVGRILRELEGKKKPVVFDLVDRDLKLFRSYAKARAKWYKAAGADIRIKG